MACAKEEKLPEKTSQAAVAAIDALNMLYSGPHHFPPPATSLTSSVRARADRARSNIFRILHDMCGPPASDSANSYASKPALNATTNIADLPAYQVFPELSAVFSDPNLSMQRGVFQRIQAEKLDLLCNRPPPDPANARLWIRPLPAELRPLFKEETNPFRTSVIDYLKSPTKDRPVPQARLHASSKKYAALLEKAESAGMLHWLIISKESSQYSALANNIEMTLFAVSKSRERNRIISWPLIQNDAIPQPPYTSLPNPSLFEAIRTRGNTTGAFFLDISNMFHNITLPLWLSRLLPMRPISLSHLTPATQRRIAKRTTLPAQTTGVLLRPCQATMPMGFKWAVFIAHTFVSAFFDEAFRLLKSSRLAIPSMKVSRLRAEEAPFLVSKCSPLLLHIIDDAAVITLDWPAELVTAWHKLTRNLLRINLLPVADNKSSHPLEVIQDSISFIECKWNLKLGSITPS